MIHPVLKKLLLTLLPLASLSAQNQEPFEPLYAGTLLCLFSENVDPGELSVQPFIFITRTNTSYNRHWATTPVSTRHNNTLLLSLETGITPFVDVNLVISENYNTWNNKHTWRFGDTTLYFGFQLAKNQKNTPIPDIRILLGEIFPTGKYQHLDNLLIDSSGTGAFQTSTALIIRKIFYTYPHPFSANLNLIYNFPTHVHIHGLSYYGGDPHTRGTVHPGQLFVADLGLEVSLTRNWEIGLDLRYEHQNRSPFHGTTTLPANLPSSERFSLAPCLEYNYSEAFSFAIGSWFSVAGRNATPFRSWVANVFYLF